MKHINLYKTITIILALVLLALFTFACTQTSAPTVSTPAVLLAPTKAPTPAPTRTPSVPVQGFTVKTIGVKHAVVLLDDLHGQITDVTLLDADGGITVGKVLHQPPHILATFDDLVENTPYTVAVKINDNRFLPAENARFTTDAYARDPHALKAEIEKKLPTIAHAVPQDYAEQMIRHYKVQAALKMLGFNSGEPGVFNPLLQSHVVRFEYALHTQGGITQFDEISGYAGYGFYEILIDIICAETPFDEHTMIGSFTVTPHTLTDYASNYKKGYGRFASPQYLMDQIALDPDMAALYATYPFDIDSDAFYSKYGKGVAYNTAKDNAALNKALFSMHAQEWLEQVAAPKENLIGMYDLWNAVTANTMCALSFMTIDAYRETGEVYAVSTSYRWYTYQRALYYKTWDVTQDDYNQSGRWHKLRQVWAAVPGFSNHQYGIAIDFAGQDGILTFKDTAYYDFMQKNAHQYGFYNYDREPWHWAYLGIIFE